MQYYYWYIQLNDSDVGLKWSLEISLVCAKMRKWESKTIVLKTAGGTEGLLVFLNIKFWIANKVYYKISNISVCETEFKFWKYRITSPDVTSWKCDGFAVLTPLAGCKKRIIFTDKNVFHSLRN